MDALSTTDRAKKTEYYTKAQEMAWKDAPWIFLCVEQNVAASAANFKNFNILPDGGYDFYDAELVK